MRNILLIFIFILNILAIRAQTPELRIPAAHDCNLFTFSKDDKLLFTVGNNVLKIWDMEGPYLLKSLKWAGMDTLYNKVILFSNDPDRVCMYAEGQLRFINMRTLEWENTRFKMPAANCMAITNDGKTLYSYAGNFIIDKHIFQKTDLITGKTTNLYEFKSKDKEHPDGLDASSRMEISPDGTMLLAEGFESGGILFDLKTNKISKVFDPKMPLFFSKNGNIITSTHLNNDDNNANVPNPKYLIEELEIGTWKTLRKLDFSIKNDDDLADGNGIVWISDDHKSKILYENHGKFYVFDAKNWKISPRLNYKLGTTYGGTHFVHISDGGKYLFANSSMECFSLETGNLVKKVGFFPFLPFNLVQANLGEDKGMFAGYKYLNFDKKGFRVEMLPMLQGCQTYDYLQRSIYRLLPNQKKVLMTAGNSLNNYEPKSYTLGTDTSQVSEVEIEADLMRSAIEIRPYDDNNSVIISSEDRLIVMDTKSWKQKQQIVFEDEYYNAHFSRRDESYILERSADRTKVIINLKKDGNDDYIHRIACLDLMQKRMIWSYDEPNALSNPIYAEGGKQVWLINEGGSLVKLDAQTGKLIQKSAKIPYANGSSQISASCKFLLNFINTDETVFGITQVNVVDLATLQLKYSLKQQNLPFINYLFIENERLFVTQDEDLKIWETATGKLLARIILIEGGSDWIVSTPDGRFDGSKGGLKKMHYVRGKEIIPLEQLYEGFYTPNLLSEVMDPNSIKSAAPIEISNIKMPPTVRIVNKATGLRNLEVVDDEIPNYESSLKTLILSVEADGLSDKITEMRLYHNGKLLNEGTRGFKPVAANGNKSQQDFEVTLVAGENRFKAIAINSQRTESKPGEITIQYKATAEEKKQDDGITLHLIVVGINQYKNAKHNLNYAEADALGFKDELKKNCGKVMTNCQEYYITNEKAVKEGITAALEKVVANAKPQDVFLFYYAGHGVVAENNEFYLVPHDVTQIYGNDGGLAQKGLSAIELRNFSTRIKAQKQLFILDACHSSGALTAIAQRGAAEEKAIAQLARSTGTHWLTAAGTEQYASEFSQLGHGVFTYVLLEGFKGAADGNNDGKITVKEIDAYLQDQVPILTEKYKGSAQYPSSYGNGMDFPVGVR
jgi:hypothetical protein